MNPYFAIEVGWLRHPKTRSVHRDARLLWVAGGLHAVEHETDGFISQQMINLLAAEAQVRAIYVRDLVASGLWHDLGNGYEIHDFLDRNPSKAQREALRKKWRDQKANQRSTVDSTADIETVSTVESTPLLSFSSSSTSLNTKTQDQNTRAIEVETAFDDFWSCYPRKVGKPKARTAFATAFAKAQGDAIGSGLTVWCSYWRGQGDEQFVPHPSTWLNQERWNDRPPAPPKRKTNAGLEYLLSKMNNNPNGSNVIETRDT